MTKFKGRGMVQLTGRGQGKSASAYWQQYMKFMANQKPAKIIWHQLPGRKLKATWTPTGNEYGINESDMQPIQDWQQEHIPSARRLSFDTWLFKEDKHVTMFLLMWS